MPPRSSNGSNGPEDDPYNRAPFPWSDTSGYPNAEYGPADQSMYQYYQQLGFIRSKYSALRTGDFRTLLADDTNFVYSFGRSNSNAKLAIVLNNDNSSHSESIPVGGYIADGTVLTDQLTGSQYTVSGGFVSVLLAAKGEAILADDAGATLRGHASVPGRSAGNLPVDVKVSGVTTGTVTFNRTLDSTGTFTVTALSPGSVSVRVKNSQTLAVSQQVTLATGMNDVTIAPPLREGDANNDNCVNTLDFGIVRHAFGSSPL